MAFSMLATRKVASSAAARPQARSAGMRRPLVAVRATENEGRRGMDRAPADGGFWDEKRDVSHAMQFSCLAHAAALLPLCSAAGSPMSGQSTEELKAMHMLRGSLNLVGRAAGVAAGGRDGQGGEGCRLIAPQ